MRFLAVVALFFLFMMNKTRVTTTARNKAVPTIAPAMPAAEMGDDELVGGGGDGAEAVCEGPEGEEVEEGE